MKNKDITPARDREIHIAEVYPYQQEPPASPGAQVAQAVIANFPQIISMVGDIIRTQQEITQSSKATDNRIREMREKTAALRAETSDYVTKKQLDMNNSLGRMNAIRALMQDFYANNNGQISSEDFCKVITTIINSDKI